MVGVFVRNDYAVEPIDLGIEKLHTKIRRAINQNTRAVSLAVLTLDQQRATTSSVLWIVRIARAPAQCDPRHTHGRAAAQNRKG
jgi:hypothetical protein